MKKSQESIDLAARIANAASKPAGASFVPPAITAPASAATFPAATRAVPPTRPSKTKGTQPKEKVPETVPITLRPRADLLNKYVLKASERTREEGRVVSAQQIMLEKLEWSDA